jgi:hypothetical protein
MKKTYNLIRFFDYLFHAIECKPGMKKIKNIETLLLHIRPLR